MFATALAGVAVLACAGPEQAGRTRHRDAAGRLVVFVDSYPLRYFAERIGGDRVMVVFPAPAGVDPAYWTPDPRTIAEYQDADLILVTGAGYAKWVETATLPGSRLVDTSASLTDRLLPLEGAVTHSHGGMGEHSHTGFATTLWLDPGLAAEQARAVADALTTASPEGAAGFAENLIALRRDLDQLDERLAAVAGRIGDTPLLFSHPVYQYLARRYGLNGRSLHWDPSEVPGHFAWAAFEEKLEGHPARFMVWEGEPVAETAVELERRGIQSLVFSPCATAPESGDYLSVMMDNIARLEAAFGPPLDRVGSAP
ncbi:MAG TPA: metal ABC transporter substrate-binding protein [Thermoanaerobaculia bacterium]|nr:metal ABC transporter substrate-binding protein [Thermoanaerobaculia bacterium]